MEFPLRLGDGKVIDARLAASHQPFGVELPKFVPVGSPPLVVCVAVFVLEANRDSVAFESPKVFHEAVVSLFVPFAAEEFANFVATLKELVAVSPS